MTDCKLQILAKMRKTAPIDVKYSENLQMHENPRMTKDKPNWIKNDDPKTTPIYCFCRVLIALAYQHILWTLCWFSFLSQININIMSIKWSCKECYTVNTYWSDDVGSIWWGRRDRVDEWSWVCYAFLNIFWIHITLNHCYLLNSIILRNPMTKKQCYWIGKRFS